MDYQNKTQEELIGALIKLEEENKAFKKIEFDLNERVKVLSCHNRISQLLNQPELSTGEIIQRITELIPPALQFPEFARVCITVNGKRYQTNSFIQTTCSLIQEITFAGKKAGEIIVCYNDEVCFIENIFLPEEVNLLFSIAVNVAKLIDRDTKVTQLEQTENNYKLLIENINDIVYEYDNHGVLKYISPVVEKNFGFAPDDILGKNFIEFVGGSEEYAAKVLATLSERGQIHTEYRIPTKAGDIRWANLSTRAVFEGEIFMGGAGVVTDITEKKLAEIERNRNELLYRSILNASPDTITITDLEGKILYTSGNAHKMFGFDASYDFSGHSNLEYVDEKDHEKASSAISKMFQNEFSGADEYTGIRADGSKFDIEVNGEFIRDDAGQPVNMIFVTRDITQRKQAEDTLQKTQASYRNLIENINDVIYEVDVFGIVKFISPPIFKLIGFHPEEIIGKSFLDFVGDNRDVLAQRFSNLVNTNTTNNEYQIFSKTGELRWIRLSSKGMFENGQFVGGSGTMVDVTEKKLIELELQKSEALYSSILNVSPDAMTIINFDGTIVFTSPANHKIFGYELSYDLTNHSIFEFVAPEDRQRAFENTMRKLDGEELGVVEYKGLKGDGSVFDFEISCEFIRDAENKPVQLLLIIRDVTNRNLLEQKLKKTEDSFKNMVERINDVVFEVTNEGIIKYVSPSIEGVLGYTPEELTGKNFFTYMYPDDIPDLSSALANLANRDSSNLEYRYFKKNGTVRWVRSSTQPTFEGGKMVGGIGVLMDIHERKLAEESLRMSELRYKSFFEGNTSIMILVDPETGEIKDANPAASNYYGWSRDEICRMSIAEINTLSAEEITAEMQLAIKEERKYFYFKHRLANGDIHDVEVYSGPIVFGEDTLLYSIIHDITERVQIERELRESEEKYRSIFNSVQDAYYEASIDGILLDISPAIEIISKGQYKPEDLIGKSLLQFYADPNARAYFYAQLQKTRRVNDYEIAFENKDGSIVPVAITSSLVYDINGNPLKITGSMRDISERKKSETALKLSEEKYRLLFANNPQPMWIYDLETLCILEVNQSSVNQYGYTRDEFLQLTIKDIRPKEDIPDLIEDVEKAHQNRSVKGVWRHIWKNGMLRYVEISAQSINFNGRQARHVLINDITDRILTETEIKDKSTLLTNLIINMKEGILLEDSERKIVLTNQLFCDMFGIPVQPEAMVGADCTDSAEQSKLLFKDPDKFVSEIAKILKDKKYILNDELELVDGRYFERDYIPTYLDNQYCGHLWKYRDITEKKLAENELKKISQAVEQSPIMTLITDLSGDIEYVNPAFTKVTGYNIDELYGKNPRILSSGEKSKEDYILLWKTISMGNKWQGEFHNKKKNGELYWAGALISPIIDSNGKITHYVSVEEDISQRKKTEKEIHELNENLEIKIQQRTEQLAKTNNELLHEIEERKRLDEALIASEQSYQTVVENVNEVIFQTDAEGLWLFLNKSWEQITGFKVEESLGQLFLDYVHPDDRQRNMDLFTPLINREKDYCRHEIRYLTKDGGFRWIEVFARLGLDENDQITGTYGTLQDISERKRAEDFENEMLQLSPQLTGITASEISSALNMALSRIGNFLNADRAYIFEFDFGEGTMSNTYEWCNKDIGSEIGNLQGIPCDILPMWMEILHAHQNIIIPSVTDLPASWKAEKEILEPQGIQSLIVIPMLIEDQLIGFVGLDSVIMKRDYSVAEINILKVWSSMLASLINNHRTEGLLEQTRQNFEIFFNTIDDFLWVLDDTGKIIHINNTVVNRLGYLSKELESESILKVHPAERRDEAARIVGEMLQGKSEFCPVPVVTKEGHVIPVETRVKHGFWNSKPAIFGVSKDISKIQLSEQKFSTAFQSNSALMAISTFESGQYLDVNNTFLETLGYSSEEVLGKTNMELGFFPNRELRSQIIKNIEEQGQVRKIEEVIRRKDGTLRTILLSADIIYLGEEKCLLTVSVDITDRKHAEELLQWNKSLLELMSSSSPLGFLVVDNRTDDILYFNNRFCQIWGIEQLEDRMQKGELKNNDIIPYCLPVLMDVPAFAESCKPLQSENNREVVSDEIPFVGDRTIRRFSTQIRGANDEYFGRFYIFEDITENKQAEEKLKRARQDAEQANVAKSEFLSRMSHELRTPMNSILGFAQILEMSELTSGQKKGVGHILRSGKHLLSLINEVLDISRIEAGRLSISIEPIKLNSVLTEMLDVMRPLATEKQIKLSLSDTFDVGLFVKSDRQSLKQILLNLLNNAIKYNKPKGVVIIKTELIPTEENKEKFVRISISDTGVGIAGEDIPKLFTPFERIGANKNQIEGTGLGLAVVKKLIEAMGGMLGVESIPGEGSTFWIELPCAENQLDSLQKTELISNADTDDFEKHGVILYIEDNASNVELVEQILLMERSGLKLISDSTGKHAVGMALQYKPNLILLDLNLPDMHGGEVLRMLKNNKLTKNIPVVIISADAMQKQIESLIAEGAKAYLTKPLDVLDLLQVVDESI